LEQVSRLATRRKRKSVARLTKNSKFFKAIIHAIKEKKADNIVSLDLRKIPEAVADYFIICEASSTTQVKAIADNVMAHVEKTGY
jgi:ribosome-associated protein